MSSQDVAGSHAGSLVSSMLGREDVLPAVEVEGFSHHSRCLTWDVEHANEPNLTRLCACFLGGGAFSPGVS